MKPTKIAFEKNYSDESGVEFAVRYDGSATDQIEFLRVFSARFPVDQLDWLIASLTHIRVEVLEKADRNG